MNKRSFLKTLGNGLLLTPFLPSSGTYGALRPESLLPPALQKGDIIGVVSPSATLFEEMPFSLAREVIQALGFKVKMGQHVNDRYGLLAGTEKERAGRSEEHTYEDQ